jgi:hypothetical protein
MKIDFHRLEKWVMVYDVREEKKLKFTSNIPEKSMAYKIDIQTLSCI